MSTEARRASLPPQPTTPPRPAQPPTAGAGETERHRDGTPARGGAADRPSPARETSSAAGGSAGPGTSAGRGFFDLRETVASPPQDGSRVGSSARNATDADGDAAAARPTGSSETHPRFPSFISAGPQGVDPTSPPPPRASARFPDAPPTVGRGARQETSAAPRRTTAPAEASSETTARLRPVPPQTSPTPDTRQGSTGTPRERVPGEPPRPPNATAPAETGHRPGFDSSAGAGRRSSEAASSVGAGRRSSEAASSAGVGHGPGFDSSVGVGRRFPEAASSVGTGRRSSDAAAPAETGRRSPDAAAPAGADRRSRDAAAPAESGRRPGSGSSVPQSGVPSSGGRTFAEPTEPPRSTPATDPAPVSPDPALSWSAPMVPGGTLGAGRPFVSFGEPEGYDEKARPRPLGGRMRSQAAAAAACLVLGLGLIGGAVTGSWLAGDSGDGAGSGTFSAAGGLWHSVPVDRLFPPTVQGQGAGPGGADRTWTRIAVAPDSDCEGAFDPLLRKALTPVGCQRLLRATYTDATQSYVTTVGLLFTEADAPAMAALRTRFAKDGLDRRTDLMPLPYAAKDTAAAGFGAEQRASWTISVLTDAPVVVYAVSGWADGRTVDDPEPAEEAMESGATTAPAQAGLGNEAQGLADRIERGLRRDVGSATEQPS
ncbi:hypothetical protein [Streptomyces sp. S.PNR 29]|uniref:hypothetical protein n=1 Tax=Streptomyces sp. S.PNR 29 TaxID=2973805 RepID=UPI0025AEF38B|nr:hypothetical protein [Streptomyces sp. S.PNR 29]MDN0196084.1 hypothetical protein [Streptomyces sp. S.PNR 29]